MKPQSWAMGVVAAVALGFAACGGGGGGTGGKEVSCTNRVDDNKDGLVDCEDPTCSAHPACIVDAGMDGGNGYEKEGLACSAQETCLIESFRRDEPLPRCLAGACRKSPQAIDVRLEVDARTWPTSVKWLSTSTRFISKTAVDGSPVTCDVVRQVASGTTGDHAGQLEESKRFNYLSYDTTPIPSNEPSGGAIYALTRVATSTGSDFLIWTEAWSGPRNGLTLLPTGTRDTASCTESGAPVAELKPEDHWPEDGSTTGRTIRVVLPPP